MIWEVLIVLSLVKHKFRWRLWSKISIIYSIRTQEEQRGTSHCMNALSTHLLISLNAGSESNIQFSLTDIQVTETTTQHHENDSSQNFEETVTEITTKALILNEFPIPDLSQAIDCQNLQNDTVDIGEICRKTAPPISILREKRAEELAWVKFFPNGKKWTEWRETTQIYSAGLLPDTSHG